MQVLFFVQISPYISSPGEYALSKDVDVSLWLDSRQFNHDPLLNDTSNFVIIDSKLHKEFDKFKHSETRHSYSLIPVNELLQFYCSQFSGCLESSKVVKFGNHYLELQNKQVDNLIEWVCTMRTKYTSEGEQVFSNPVLSKLILI